tara:strand:- start:429 stop:1055 length:627 start_codon:yes stop_codon:yes gene_type:complete
MKTSALRKAAKRKAQEKLKRKDRVTAVKNPDGTITKTRKRRGGSVKSVKTYEKGKMRASEKDKYRKDGSLRKSVRGKGNKAVIRKYDKHGEKVDIYRRGTRRKENLDVLGGIAGTSAAMATFPQATIALTGAALAESTLAGIDRELKKKRPKLKKKIQNVKSKVKKVKSNVKKRVKKTVSKIKSTPKRIKKGIINKRQTGNRRGKTKN